MTGRARTRRMPIWGWLLIAPFLLTLLVPPSIMPARTADGGMSIVICTGDGPLEMRIDPATGEPLPDHKDDAGAGCHWNALRDAATLAEPVFAAPAAAFFSERAIIATAGVARRPTRFERPPARASPFPI